MAMKGDKIRGYKSATLKFRSKLSWLKYYRDKRRNFKYPLYLIAIFCCTCIPEPVLTASLEVEKSTTFAQSQSVEAESADQDLPIFEQTESNVTAFVGQTVYLPCRVRNLRDKVVSWMRSRDLHILTSSEFAFSSDHRFRPEHIAGSDAWTLRLDSAKKSDSGRYECQVNTEPKMMYAVQLAVTGYESTAPVATIMGPREQRVPSGATITLRCVVTSPYQTRPIRGVQWFRDNILLTFQAERGGINVETEKDAAQTVSVVTLATVTQQDVGKYTCRPTEGRADTIVLRVEQGERSETMQRDASYISSSVMVNGGSVSKICTHRYRISFPLLLVGLLVLPRNGQTFGH